MKITRAHQLDAMESHVAVDIQIDILKRSLASGRGVGYTDLLLVVQTLVIILQYWYTLPLPRIVVGSCVDYVARQDFLPEWKAARWAYCLFSDQLLPA